MSSPRAGRGQFGCRHEAPRALLPTSAAVSLRLAKNACHSASTDFGSAS